MFLRYGSYTHASQEARVSITREPLKNAGGDYYGYKERWDISGRLVGASATDITTALQELEAAYLTGGYDLTLLLPDGSTASNHQLLSANCKGGTKIAQPVSYPEGSGAEYANYRTYTVAIEGEIGINNSQNAITEWRETIAFTGNGGPRIVAIEVRNGAPQMQMVSQRTPVRVIQSGRAVGYRQWPFPPGPIWPGYEQGPDRGSAITSPTTTGSGASRSLQDYEITWSYSFIAPGPLSGLPHPQP